MNQRTLLLALLLLGSFFSLTPASAQTIIDNESGEFRVTGYLRTGFGFSEGGDTQANFQMPGALNKYSLGNQADTYGELAFDYKHYLNKERSKSLETLWMVSIFEPFGSEDKMSFNFTEQLYLKANNLLGYGESIWAGRRFYDRKAIYMLDRQWLNPGQGGWGAGVENLLNGSEGEDLKFSAWQIRQEDITSFESGQRGDLLNYTADVRWTGKRLSERVDINFALNYSYRAANKELGYEGRDGYGAFAWINFANKERHITNTTAVLLRQGANITKNHWSGASQWENPDGDNLIMHDLNRSHSLEINNDFLYDDKERFSLNVVAILVASNYGTDPYYLNDGERSYIEGRGDMFYWASAGARGAYYVSRFLRPTVEYSYEYGHNEQLGVAGSLHRFTFTPELSLSKGYYSRPVLRPFVSYSLWGDQLEGYIGTTPKGAPYGDTTKGFTCGMQFEIWW